MSTDIRLNAAIAQSRQTAASNRRVRVADGAQQGSRGTGQDATRRFGLLRPSARRDASGVEWPATAIVKCKWFWVVSFWQATTDRFVVRRKQHG